MYKIKKNIFLTLVPKKIFLKSLNLDGGSLIAALVTSYKFLGVDELGTFRVFKLLSAKTRFPCSNPLKISFCTVKGFFVAGGVLICLVDIGVFCRGYQVGGTIRELVVRLLIFLRSGDLAGHLISGAFRARGFLTGHLEGLLVHGGYLRLSCATGGRSASLHAHDALLGTLLTGLAENQLMLTTCLGLLMESLGRSAEAGLTGSLGNCSCHCFLFCLYVKQKIIPRRNF